MIYTNAVTSFLDILNKNIILDISNKNIIHRPLKKKECVLEQLNMRCKADRAKLNGWDCWECEEVIYKYLQLNYIESELNK